MSFNDILKEIKSLNKPIVFMCIGTDKHVWDSVGPLTGTMLEDLGVLSYGDINNTITAINVENVEKNIRKIHKNHCLIVIDASVTKFANRHKTIEITRGGIKPGNGVGKDIKRVGDYSLLFNIHSDKVEDKRIRNPYNASKQLVSFIKYNLLN